MSIRVIFRRYPIPADMREAAHRGSPRLKASARMHGPAACPSSRFYAKIFYAFYAKFLVSWRSRMPEAAALSVRVRLSCPSVTQDYPSHARGGPKAAALAGRGERDKRDGAPLGHTAAAPLCRLESRIPELPPHGPRPGTRVSGDSEWGTEGQARARAAGEARAVPPVLPPLSPSARGSGTRDLPDAVTARRTATTP